MHDFVDTGMGMEEMRRREGNDRLNENKDKERVNTNCE